VLQFGELAYGIGRARRGWLEKGDVLNTRTVQHLGRFWGKHLPEAAR
jgi:DNA polymerase (family 10)